ncbi:MAG: hypothetical protein QGF45_06900 [SAR324 cluster bacterium]|nr:hypothetical protein [SAR324 cluster bacterium]
MKSGIHLMYLVTSPFVLEFPGEDFTIGLVYGSGKLESTQTSTTYDSDSGYSAVSITDTWIFTTSELTGRYYIGNSFNIPFGVAMYTIQKNDWKHSDGTIWDLDYKMTQLNLGLGNEWTYDWGGYLGIDYFQGGSKLSDKVTVKQTSGTASASSESSAEKESTDINAFGGALIVTFGFGF